jgi:hypothetical protein
MPRPSLSITVKWKNELSKVFIRGEFMFIYLIANHDTGKYYIGQHKGNSLKKYLQTKFSDARHGRGGSSRLFNSMRKHPFPSAWSIHALRSDIQTKEELDETEQEFIKFLRSQNPEYGYNIRQGGGGLTSEDAKRIAKNRLADPRFLPKLSKALKRAWSVHETQVKHSESAKKVWLNSEFRNNFIKKRWNLEARDKASRTNRERFSSLEVRVKQSETVKKKWSDPQLLAEQSKLVKTLWSNPKTRIKMMAGVRKRAATTSLNGKKTMSKPGHLSYMTKKGQCQRWNINRGNPCTCGYHPSSPLMPKLNDSLIQSY